jgi:hypothetical protein
MEITQQVVDEWGTSKAKLKHWKSLEDSQRRAICNEILGSQTRGSKKLIVECVAIDGHSFQLELTAKPVTNVSFDEEALDDLERQGKLTPTDKACFETKRELKPGKLKDVPEDSELWKAITKKPGMPQLEAKKK